MAATRPLSILLAFRLARACALGMVAVAAAQEIPAGQGAEQILKVTSVPPEDDLLGESERELKEAEAQAQDRMRALEEKIQAEEPDAQWASAAERSIEASAVRETPGLRLIAAACRFSLCRVELTRDPAVPPERTFRELLALAPWPAQSMTHIAQTEEVIVYIAREGYELPN